jgi:hypothetical protein
MNNQSDEKVVQGPKDSGEARGGNVFRLVPRADRGGEMTMTTQSKTGAMGELKPRITLTTRDHERLSVLARAAANTMPDVAAVLTEELDRAHVLAKGRHPEYTV